VKFPAPPYTWRKRQYCSSSEVTSEKVPISLAADDYSTIRMTPAAKDSIQDLLGWRGGLGRPYPAPEPKPLACRWCPVGWRRRTRADTTYETQGERSDGNANFRPVCGPIRVPGKSHWRYRGCCQWSSRMAVPQSEGSVNAPQHVNRHPLPCEVEYNNVGYIVNHTDNG